MAKRRRSAAQKRAFAKMIAGLRRSRRGGRARRAPVRRARVTRRRKRIGATPRAARRVRLHNPLAVLANPSVGYSKRYASAWESVFGASKKKRKGRKTMAKKRRKGGHRKGKRSHARKGTRRKKNRRASFARRVPRGTRVIYLNPRRKGRGRRRHRRNPGMGGLARRVFVPYAAGFLASMGAAVIDASMTNYPAVRQLAKVGGAIAIAVFGHRYPTASAAAIGALAGSQGYTLGTKLAGGMIAHTPAEAVKGLGEMQQTYPELGALLNGGVGALLNGLGGPENVDMAAVNYATALNNMADNDD